MKCNRCSEKPEEIKKLYEIKITGIKVLVCEKCFLEFYEWMKEKENKK